MLLWKSVRNPRWFSIPCLFCNRRRTAGQKLSGSKQRPIPAGCAFLFQDHGLSRLARGLLMDKRNKEFYDEIKKLRMLILDLEAKRGKRVDGEGDGDSNGSV